MNSKQIVLIAGSEHTREVLHKQLYEYLNAYADIKSYAVEKNSDINLNNGDLYVFSSKLVVEDVNFKPGEIPYVIATRTINYSNIDKLFHIPEGSDVLFVNDVKDTAYDCIDNLIRLGISHLRYFPYYPEIKEYKCCDIAVTPGEVDKVPQGVKTIIDLGPRLFDMGTLIEIMHKLGYFDEKVTDISLGYVKKIIELGKKVAVKNNEVITLNRDLERIIIDIGSFQNKNENKIVYKFKQEDYTHHEARDEILKKRYFAKYSFEDIIGESQAIKKTKKLAKKLASTELSILIEGESGTGKELFAFAIHNLSKRRDEPFLAVNFSAIPESLIESELFGYEDGSFTGARRGGKIGYFEQADGGTIFLDEIGDASLTVQARLLRVLQEKEIMRIGGDRLIPLDIRIIAATNKNIKDFIDKGKFREDLYYRLKMGYILIPPLSSRKSDVILIAENYIENRTNLSISEEVLEALNEHEWKGNVRELINTLEYAIAVCAGNVICIQNLPADFKCHERSISFSGAQNDKKMDDADLQILNVIYMAEQDNCIIGRKKICEDFIKKGIMFSEQNIRTRLNNLQKSGFVIKHRGKAGTNLTEKGEDYIKKLSG